MLTLLFFLNEIVPLRRVGKEHRGPCWRCGGTKRFVVLPEGNRGFCYDCGWRGDAIQLLRDRDGLSYRNACKAVGKDLPDLRVVRTVEQETTAYLRRRFLAWEKAQIVTLTDQYRLVLWESRVAQLGLWLDDRARDWWHVRLDALALQLDGLAAVLDLLNDTDQMPQRVQLWEQERKIP